MKTHTQYTFKIYFQNPVHFNQILSQYSLANAQNVEVSLSWTVRYNN